jgi:hypothetical protein
MESVTINGNAQIGGESVAFGIAETGDNLSKVNAQLPVAKVGQLTTRTDNNTGELTMEAGHGLITADVIDIFWVNTNGTIGSRRGVTVGTVATNAVPIDLGAGDNLPANLTAVTVQKPTTFSFGLIVANLQALVAKGDSATFQVSIQQADGTEEFHYTSQTATDAFVWWNSSGFSNPVGADTTKAVVSNGDSTAVANIMVMGVADN